MTVSERVAYLKGLAAGIAMNADSAEGKLFAAVIDALQEVADEIDDINSVLEEYGEDIDAISEALEDVEDFVYEDEDDDDDEDEDDEDWDDDDEDLYGVTCPTCNAEIHVSANQVEEGEIICPNCGQELELEYDEDEEEDD